MSIKNLGGKNQEVEIITKKYEIYIHRHKSHYFVDYFNSRIKNDEQAHEGSSEFEDFESLRAELEALEVSGDDIAELKKIYRLF